MEYLERYLPLSPIQGTLDTNCLAPWRTPTRMANKAPNGEHPSEIEKSSFELFSQAQQVEPAFREMCDSLAPTSPTSLSNTAWPCNEYIVKPTPRLRKNRCAFVPTLGAFYGSLKSTFMRGLCTKSGRSIVLGLCVSTLSACAGAPQANRAEALHARQCVATVLLCDDCHY